MKYVATYKTTPVVKSSIIAAIHELIADSQYYSMSQTGFGSGLVYRRSSEGQWKEWYIRGIDKEFSTWEEVEKFEPTWEWVQERGVFGWVTCSGNTEQIEISGDVLILTRAGRRHGITNYFGFLEGIEPAEVILYESQCPDASPWAKDLEVSK